MRSGTITGKKPSLAALRTEFERAADPTTAKALSRFFKTGKGEYAQGDRFLGLMVPQTRLLAAKFRGLPDKDIFALLRSPWHEERLCALLMLKEKFLRGGTKEKAGIYRGYLSNTRFINNWDLVDITAPEIVGGWLKDKSKRPLHELAASGLLWERRIAVLACFKFIQVGESSDALAIAGKLLSDGHDLMHKAVGWMLREVGKRCSETILLDFLRENYQRLPRTALRYAIERFPETKRKKLLAGIF